ncbi:MAG: ATP-binding cassette domain-containing protein, partial [Planctomycetes bacterium]|nr:ATP-binding cassette domain-containing protein [Planctomycetota bacterium]
VEVTALPERELVRRRFRGDTVGLVFQAGALFDFLDVEGNLRWPLEEAGRDRVDSRAAAALAMVELDPEAFLHRPVETLSGGERRRVALARALVLEPRVVLYDEPTTGLDPPTAAGITRLIHRLRDERGMTALVTTHDMGSARAVADRVALLRDGALLFHGRLAEAEARPEVKAFIEGLRVQARDAGPGGAG